MNICPFPNCGYAFDMLTKYHCETAHHLPRHVLIKKYGEPKELRTIPNRLKQNMKAFKPITQSQFIR